MPRKKAAADAASDSLAKKTDSIEEMTLRAVLDAVAGKYGKGAIMLSGVTEVTDVERIPTGHKTLDDVLGGGWPRGRIVEIYGAPSSAKTTVALDACLAAQSMGLRAGFVDVEHALDAEYARGIGVDIDSMPISQPDSAEQAMDIAEMMVKSKAFGVVVIDSVAALVTQAELDGEMGDQHVGRLARLMSQSLKKLLSAVYKSKTLIIFINQERSAISPGGYGPSETTCGGRALPYYASVRLKLRVKEKITKTVGGDIVPIGQITLVNNVKNKVAIPGRKFEIQVDYPTDGQRPGLNKIAPLVDAALDSGLLKKSGSWFALDGTNIAQGRPALLRKVAEDESLRKALEA